MSRSFGPKSSDDPSIGKPCPACKDPFAAGDFTKLIALGPGKDVNQRARAEQGLAYKAVALEIHAACADPDL